MKTSKRKDNLTGLKVKFIPATNFKNDGFKITQTNNNKSVFIDSNFGNLTPIEFFTQTLNKDKKIKSFNLLIDNTQNSFYTFVINVKSKEIHNILENFKK